jgi:hypothetical protein
MSTISEALESEFVILERKIVRTSSARHPHEFPSQGNLIAWTGLPDQLIDSPGSRILIDVV